MRSLLVQSQEQQERIAQMEEVLHAEPVTAIGMNSLVNSGGEVDTDLCAQFCLTSAWLQ